MTYDLVIRGARIIDGSGSAGFVGDLGIRGERIAAIGKVEGAATRTIWPHSKPTTRRVACAGQSWMARKHCTASEKAMIRMCLKAKT